MGAESFPVVRRSRRSENVIQKIEHEVNNIEDLGDKPE